MANPRFVSAGQPLVISASVYNRIMSLLQKFESGAVPAGIWAAKIQSVGQRSAQAIMTTVKNTTGHDFGVFTAVPIGDTAVDYSAGDNELADFQTRSTMTTDNGRDGTLNWGIALEAIKDGAVGRVLMSGLIPAKVTKWPGEDWMVDFDNEDTADWKLYTSAAGCASIVWIEDVADEDEAWAILHVHGYRKTEPSCWAILEDPLHGDGTGTNDEADARLVTRAADGTGWSNVAGRFGATRIVKSRCFKLASGRRLPGSTYVQLDVDPVGGRWYVSDALSCDEAVP